MMQMSCILLFEVSTRLTISLESQILLQCDFKIIGKLMASYIELGSESNNTDRWVSSQLTQRS